MRVNEAVLERRDAQRAVDEAELEGHRRGRDHRRAEAAVAPGLPRVGDLEAEQRRHLVVVEPARRADVDEQPVDLAALEAAVLERRATARVGHRGDAASAMRPKPTVPMPTTATPVRPSRRAARPEPDPRGALVVGAERRRRPADRRRRALELDREAGSAHAVDAGVDDHLPRQRLLLVDDLGEVVDEARGMPSPEAAPRPSASPSRAAKSGASSASSSSRCATRSGLSAKRGSLDESRGAEFLAELREHRVGAHAHVELAVARLEHPVGSEEREAAADLAGQPPRPGVVGDVVADQVQRGVIERGLDALAPPRCWSRTRSASTMPKAPRARR